MALTVPPRVGKIAYGALFVAVLPALLVVWAKRTADIVRLPAVTSTPLGVALILVGATLVIGGWAALWIHGGRGLPMNAYPPERLVSRGVYRLLAHPIYVGFSAGCVGISIASGSASGLWLVSPAVMLGCAALVLGFEGPELDARFGGSRPRPWLSLPAADPGPPSLRERLTLYPLVFAPWSALYGAVMVLGAPPDAVSGALPFEARVPLLEWTEAIYGSVYLAALAAPFAARRRSDLRRYAIRVLASMAIVFPLFLALPIIAPPRPFTPHGLLGELLVQERLHDTAAGAFPSYHVIFAFLAAEVFASRASSAPGRAAAWIYAVLASLSCVTTGMHTVVDVIAGVLAYLLVARGARVWERIRRLAERIANSWLEVRWGEVRFINHGLWAALSTFGGLLIVGAVTGRGHVAAALVAAAGGLVGAALWAQYIEGSPSLLRPYGFYGGLLGISLAALAAPLLGSDTWLILGAFVTAGPFIQSAGRLRCLVQGCCHGREAPAAIGIRYHHPRSRVCRIAHLEGVPVHPTQLYSIAANAFTALVLARLVSLHAPLHFLGGVYLILNGVGRFVEESYRGEPQTPIYGRLRLYQWVALGAVVAGAFITAAFRSSPVPSPDLGWPAVVAAALFGLVSGLALGVDFPGSNRRFARLV
jgi:protein-S-isoprenylcysteine O-methyltransferase Ste14